jgi:hypothetical protein
VPLLTTVVEEQPLVGVGVDTSAQAPHLASRQEVDELLDGAIRGRSGPRAPSEPLFAAYLSQMAVSAAFWL